MQRGLDRRVGECCELPAGRRDVGEAEKIPRADPDELAAFEASKPFTSFFLTGAPRDRAQPLSDELLGRLLDRELRVGPEQLDELGVPPERVPAEAARTQAPTRRL